MNSNFNRTACLLALCGLLGVSGCAGEGKALIGQQSSNTEKSIAAAREGNASTNAPLELKLAEEKLAAARAAADNKDFDKARDLLEKAQADADLAKAKSASVEAVQGAKRTRDNINTLRKEVERSEAP